MNYTNKRSVNSGDLRALSRTQPTLRPPPVSDHPQSIASPAGGPAPRGRENLGTRQMSNDRHVNTDNHLLTGEDLAVLRLVAEGLPLESVARRVKMSPRTVRRRLRNICDRLGVAHPIQAVVWAARRALI